jgi:hypothetical protein
MRLCVLSYHERANQFNVKKLLVSITRRIYWLAYVSFYYEKPYPHLEDIPPAGKGYENFMGFSPWSICTLKTLMVLYSLWHI